MQIVDGNYDQAIADAINVKKAALAKDFGAIREGKYIKFADGSQARY